MISPDTNICEQVLKLTTQQMVDVIYETLETIDYILRHTKIDYTILCGTMLGTQRHGGLIPWDDDGDIAIQLKDEARLVALTKIFADQGYVLYHEPSFGYRVWNPRRTIVRESDQMHVPFVDIFLLETEADQYVCLTDDAKSLFPGEVLPFGCFDRLVDVPFGHLTLRGLNAIDTQEHLNENFGNDWNEVAWRNFDHVLGDYVPMVRVALDHPELRSPALHSQYSQLKRQKN